jgi:hypothetical protein
MIIRMENFARLMNPETVQLNYGLGWIIQDYRGKLQIQHGGAIDGFRAHLTLMPELQLGIGILSNLDGGYANFALSNTLVDRFLGIADRDWNAEFHAVYRKELAQEVERAAALRRRRPANAPPPLPLERYAGDYHDDLLGTCQIQLKNDRLTASIGTLRTPLEHFADHMFLANEHPFRDAAFTFDPHTYPATLKACNRTFTRVPTPAKK